MTKISFAESPIESEINILPLITGRRIESKIFISS
jgi:hypothetical protein